VSEAEFKLGPLTFDGDDAWYLRDQQGSAIMSDEQYYPWVPSEEIYWRLFAAAPDMLALLKEYVAEDPCAAGDPRYARAVELIRKIEPGFMEDSDDVKALKAVAEYVGRRDDEKAYYRHLEREP
jgi:hypothetical protein